MADSNREIRPRELQAMEIWESLPESERNYAEVARQMGVTEGRAGVYVRDALTISHKEHLLPQRGRKSGSGNAAPIVEEDANPIHDLERFLATIDERITALNDQLGEADKAVAEFDAEAEVTTETERLQKIMDEATAAFEAFSSDVAAQTAWATKRQTELSKRKDDVETNVTERTERLTKKRDGLAQIIALANENPDLAEMFASNVDSAELDDDDPEALTNEPEAAGDDTEGS